MENRMKGAEGGWGVFMEMHFSTAEPSSTNGAGRSRVCAYIYAKPELRPARLPAGRSLACAYIYKGVGG